MSTFWQSDTATTMIGCANCKQGLENHVGDKCLFGPTYLELAALIIGEDGKRYTAEEANREFSAIESVRPWSG